MNVSFREFRITLWKPDYRIDKAKLECSIGDVLKLELGILTSTETIGIVFILI